jgi:hypothetical protein
MREHGFVIANGVFVEGWGVEVPVGVLIGGKTFVFQPEVTANLFDGLLYDHVRGSPLILPTV